MSKFRYSSGATQPAVHDPAHAVNALAAWLGDIVSAVRTWRARRAAIDELSRLDDRLLRDIGINRGEIRVVVDRMLSRPPAPGRRPAPDLRVVTADVARPAAARHDDLANAA
ncbi:MAG: DUF1127 domain-containing protein [Kiloniellales bacterium]